MKKIKYLILWLVFACFWLSSFSSADYSFEYLTWWKLTSLNNYNWGTLLYTIPDDLTRFPLWEVYCFSWLVNFWWSTNSSLIRVWFFQNINYNSNNKPHSSLYFSTDNSTVLNLKNLFSCFTYYTYYTKNIVISSYNSTSYSDIDIDYSILRLSSDSWWWSNDCSTCESSLEALSGAYSTLSWYYSSCQSSLDSCQSWLSWYSECQSSLSSCLEDNESLENMNTSLNDQLQQCLVNWWDWCDPEIDSWCVVWSQNYSLFWNYMWSDFSLPITNNLFLLSGMKAYSDSWVVVLWKYDNPVVDYSMDSESSERVINLVVWIFEILSWIIFVLVAWYYIKKFLSYVLFPYKK